MNSYAGELFNQLVCPRCKNPFGELDNQLVCRECSIHYPVKGGIPVMGDFPDAHCQKSDDEMEHLVQKARLVGWDRAFFDFMKRCILEGGAPLEDERVGDWKYLVSLSSEGKALVLGCGWGAVPIALSEACGKVYAVDSSWNKIALLDIRRRHLGIGNLCPVYTPSGLALPFQEGYFDLISVRDFHWGEVQPTPFREASRHVYQLLKGGGIAYWSVANRLAFHHLFGKKRGMSPVLHTFFGYKHILKEQGFTDIQFYAPLPYYDGIPLFYVPLEDIGAINFFFRNIFPLFETVSPEVKRAFALEYAIAKMGARLVLFFKLARITKVFVTGFGIIAKKPLRGKDAS